MECYSCGIIIGKEKICPNCGVDLRIYRRFVGISNYLYNRALTKAAERDLSGAVTDLRLSLQYNKVNTNARNLLGLVYFEMGESVSAIREWLISKSYQPMENRASYYLEQTKKNPTEKEKISQTVKKYNQAVLYCEQDSLDLAAIQLKRVIALNPKLIKAYQLMALIDIKDGKYDQARKHLQKAERMDHGNPITLRYMKEVVALLHGSGGKKKKADAVSYTTGNETIIQPKNLRDTSGINMVINLLIGVAIGVAITWYLVVPGVRKDVKKEASIAVTEANDTIVDKNQQIKDLEEQIQMLESEVSDAQSTYKDKNATILSYQQLVIGYDAFFNQDIEAAGDALKSVEPDLLTQDAKEVLQKLQDEVNAQYLETAYLEGTNAYNRYENDVAIEQLKKVVTIDERYDNGMAVYNLAQSYRKTEDWTNALIYYERVTELFPDTQIARNANIYIEQISEEVDTQTE